MFEFFKRKKEKCKYKIGLALGGGGTRGLGHIGFLKVLQENGIPIHYIAGTSIGSLVGGAFCAGFSPEEIYEFSKTVSVKDIKSRFLLMPSKAYTIETLFNNFAGEKVFDELKIPFNAVTVDVKTGEEVILNYGSVGKAISASCAVPGIFNPVEWEGRYLVDGGVQNPIPSDVVRAMGADIVIACDINSTRGNGAKSIRNLDVIMGTLRIMMKHVAEKGYENADLVIKPDLMRFNRTKLDGAEDMVKEGYDATMAQMDTIKKLVYGKIKKSKKSLIKKF